MKEIHLTVWEKYVCLGWESSFLRRRASFPRRTSYRLPRVLYDTLELSGAQVVYYRAFWATVRYSRTFLQNQIRCLVTDFCVTWIYWNHQRVSSEVRNVRTIQGGYGRKDEAAAILSDNLDLRSRRSKLDNNFTYKQQQQQQQQQKQFNFFWQYQKQQLH